MNLGDVVVFSTSFGRTVRGVVVLIDEVTELVVVRCHSWKKGEMDLVVVNRSDILSDAEIKALEVKGLRSELSAWVEDTTDEGIIKATELLKGLMYE